MNKINLENYAKEIVDKFPNIITKTYQNNDEIHLNVELNDMPKICDYVYKNLNARLATIICSDKQKNGGGFVIRYVFEKDSVFIFIVVSIAIAAASIYFQKDMKRMLAYSSVEHMGLISLGIGFGGLLGIYGAILQIINHAMAKPLMFFASGTISQKYDAKAMSKIKGIIKVMPVTGVLFLIGGLALVGMPPFNIFVSEFMILSSGFKSGQFLAVSIVILFLIVTFAVFLRHLFKMIFGNPNSEMKKSEMGKLAIIPMAILGSLVVIFGIYIPIQLQTLIQNASTIISGGGFA